MLREGLIEIIYRIADNINTDDPHSKLQQSQITALAYGALNILDDVEGISLYREQIKVLLTMLTKRAPLHARSTIAYQVLFCLNRCVAVAAEEEKYRGDYFF